MKQRSKLHRDPTRWEGLVEVLTGLEKEAESLVRRLVERAELSSRDLKENISDLVTQIRRQGISRVALGKRVDLTNLADRILERAKELEFGSFNRDLIIREAKKNLDHLISRLQETDLFARARVTARQTKDQVLTVLSIPSQEEVVKLSRKIANLEQRVNRLTRKAA